MVKNKILFAALLFVAAWQNALLAQNVGIGQETAQNAKLEVWGIAGFGTTAALFGSTGNGVSFQRNWPTIGFNQYRDDVLPGVNGKYIGNGFAAIQYFDYNTGTLAFDMFPSGAANTQTPAGVRAITVAQNGHTGIRTNYTNATLVVARGDGPDGTAVFRGPTYWSHFNYSVGEDTYIRAGVDGGTVFINTEANSPVLISSTGGHLWINSPPNPFFTVEINQVAGTNSMRFTDNFNYRWGLQANFLNTLNNGQGVAMDLYYNGNGRGRFQFWNGAYVSISDERLKQKITPMNDVLPAVAQMKPVKYEMKYNNPKHEQSIGFLAQDIEKLYPQLVHRTTDKVHGLHDARMMNYSQLSVIAIKALQEQYQQIRKLEAEAEELINKLSELEKQMEN